MSCADPSDEFQEVLNRLIEHSSCKSSAQCRNHSVPPTCSANAAAQLSSPGLLSSCLHVLQHECSWWHPILAAITSRPPSHPGCSAHQMLLCPCMSRCIAALLLYPSLQLDITALLPSHFETATSTNPHATSLLHVQVVRRRVDDAIARRGLRRPVVAAEGGRPHCKPPVVSAHLCIVTSKYRHIQLCT